MKTLIPYTDSNGKVTTDLKTVYRKEKKPDVEINENTRVCRLCMKLFDIYSGMALEEILRELHFTKTFFKHIPEFVSIFCSINICSYFTHLIA